MRIFISAELEKYGHSEKKKKRVVLSIDELFTNVALYGYKDSTGYILFRVWHEDGVTSIDMIDNAVAFNPLKHNDPDITMGASDREVGGLGIFIAKKWIDELDYEFANNQNILHMKVNLS